MVSIGILHDFGTIRFPKTWYDKFFENWLEYLTSSISSQQKPGGAIMRSKKAAAYEQAFFSSNDDVNDVRTISARPTKSHNSFS